MDYGDRHVVVTGGTGALGSAVVAALVEAGALCHVPFVIAAEAERFALRTHAQVKLMEVANLFLQDGPRLLQEIRAAFSRDDAAGVYQNAHALKGSAGYLGGTRASATAQALERIGGRHVCENLVDRRRDAVLWRQFINITFTIHHYDHRGQIGDPTVHELVAV